MLILLFERNMMRKKLVHLSLFSSLMTLALSSVQAETLQEALAKAYQTNPTLTGARAGQRANDENVPLARSRGLPSADLSGSLTDNIEKASNSFSSPSRIASGRINLSMPLYAGGAIKNGIGAAESRVEAGQANLRGTEASVFIGVVGAYMDVMRDEAIVSLNHSQVKVLQTNLEATKDRFDVGDLTRTDIAQSESRLALAQSQLESAEAQLIGSRERYVQLVGNEPVGLQQPPILPNLPASPDVAVDSALKNNPDLIAANKAIEASRFDIKVARSSRMPKLSAFADENYSNYLNSIGGGFSNSSRSTAAGLQATFPLYQGGAPSAQVRQSQARSSQAIEQAIAAERGVIAQTRSSYAIWRASNAVIASSEKAVSASALSLEGVRAENSVGNRSILDILNAEQEYLNAQVQLVSARRNAYVAGFSLLAAMGHAEARDLGLDGGALYDPLVNYNRVQTYKWDWANDPEPAPIATRTVDSAAQNPSVRAK
jgi:outer membrane protein